jgi:hypothetical protein
LIKEVTLMDEFELVHYGVKGMKWGIRRASRKAAANKKYERLALYYDGRSARFNKKSERAHARYDLGRANRSAVRAANLRMKSAKLQRLALSESNDRKRTTLEYRAARKAYRSTVQQMRADMISKSVGYGTRAMLYLVKSDKYAAKAAKYRMKVAANEKYIAAMNEKVSSASSETTSLGKNYLDQISK